MSEISSTEHRKALTKVRLGSHNFLIERGRWNIPKLDFLNRKCLDCNVVEDEFHCLFECPRFSEQRKIIPNYLSRKPSLFKLVSMFQRNDIQVLNKMAIVCFRIMNQYDLLR